MFVSITDTNILIKLAHMVFDTCDPEVYLDNDSNIGEHIVVFCGKHEFTFSIKDGFIRLQSASQKWYTEFNIADPNSINQAAQMVKEYISKSSHQSGIYTGMHKHEM